MELKPSAQSNGPMRNGAIAMLDILGWKGVWQRMNPEVAIEALQDIEKSVRFIWDLMMNDAKLKGHHRFKAVDLHVQTISDTVIIHATGSPHPTLELVAGCCGTAITTGIQHGLLIRGALSYGRYWYTDAIFIGPAVDEVAYWHDQTELIGACLTPHAQIAASRHSLDLSRVVRQAKVSIKGSPSKELYCVDWPRLIIEHQDAANPEAFLMDAVQDVVITPAIAAKVEWGLMFARDLRPA